MKTKNTRQDRIIFFIIFIFIIGFFIGAATEMIYIKQISVKIACDEHPNKLGVIGWCRPIIQEKKSSKNFQDGSYLIESGGVIREAGKEQVKKYYLLPIDE